MTQKKRLAPAGDDVLVATRSQSSTPEEGEKRAPDGPAMVRLDAVMKFADAVDELRAKVAQIERRLAELELGR